jgi:cardiolipin synthase
MGLHSFFFFFLSLLEMVCIVTVIFVERKNPTATIAWVLVLAFVPFVGFIAYLTFGSGFHVNKKKRYVLKRMSDNLYHQILSNYITEGKMSGPDDERPYARLIQYLTNDGEHHHTDNNTVAVYTHGEAMFAAMKKDIRKATRHIHLLYYIFRDDALGREIVAILTEKAKSGVEVRVIYDSVGSLLSRGSMFKKLRAAGGQVEPFSPLVSAISSHLRLNYRNHRKITVVDGIAGYVGGMNIGDEYLGKGKRLKPWRDTHLRLTGSSVSFLQERFLLDWMFVNNLEIFGDSEEIPPHALRAFFPPPLRLGDVGMQIVSSGPDTATMAIKSGLLEMLYAARKNIYIQTPYFVPDESIMDALRIAVSSGVDVRLMLPGLADKFPVYSATMGYARQILQSGAKVYTYPGFLHSKTIVCDGAVSSIGTANFDNRSFALNFEINAFMYNQDLAAQCEDIFLRDQEICEELSEDWYLGRSPVVRGMYNACRMLAPLV